MRKKTTKTLGSSFHPHRRAIMCLGGDEWEEERDRQRRNGTSAQEGHDEILGTTLLLGSDSFHAPTIAHI